MFENIIPIILSGGSGTRLWPLSRRTFPKQYLNLSEDSFTLLQKTQKRIDEIKNIKSPIIICNEEHRFVVAEQMKQIDVKPNSIILEPFGRNTAPAIALGAIKALEENNDPTLLVLSSDHDINNNQNFIEAVHHGLKYSKDNYLVTFGVIPSNAETGYGYIESEEVIKDKVTKGYKISNFIEKPCLEKAKEIWQNNRYFWNSGIFLFKAKIIIQEIKTNSPNVYKYCKEALNNNLIDLDFRRINETSFKSCPNISLDYAVLEKSNKGIVIPLNSEWKDLGSWKSVWESSNKDTNGNFIKGKVIIKDTENSYIRSESRLLVTVGIKDLIAIETNDAILVANKENSQEIKDIVNILKNRKIKEGIEHQKTHRPWGNFITIMEGENWKVKKIFVKAGEALSLQMHQKRSEHWIVIKGKGKVLIDNKISIVNQNESIYIPLGSKHRLINEGESPLIIIEIQSGTYLGEDDIIRFEDSYGRI